MKNNQIKVYIDKRTELAGILLRLSSYSQKFPSLVKNIKNSLYLSRINEHFEFFRQHKAVELIDFLINNFKFCYNAPHELFLCLDDNYNYNEKDEHFVKIFKGRLKESPVTHDFLKEVKVFVRESQFEKFFKNNSQFYETVCTDFKNNANIQNVLEWMKRFYNKNFENEEFYINLMPSCTGGGYGFKFAHKFICCESASEDANGKITFINNPPAIFPAHFIHEFSHPIINPMTAGTALENKSFKLPADLTQLLEKQGYASNETYINESLIRAIQAVFLKNTSAPDLVIKQFIESQKRLGFVCTDEIVEIFKNYNMQPQDKKDFSKAYSKSLAVLCKCFKQK